VFGASGRAVRRLQGECQVAEPPLPEVRNELLLHVRLPYELEVPEVRGRAGLTEAPMCINPKENKHKRRLKIATRTLLVGH
jgi:hypothetical protein